jgi:transposase
MLRLFLLEEGVHHCKQCASIMNRGLNAAKNILLKHMIEQTIERARFIPCVALPEADEVSNSL